MSVSRRLADRCWGPAAGQGSVVAGPCRERCRRRGVSQRFAYRDWHDQCQLPRASHGQEARRHRLVRVAGMAALLARPGSSAIIVKTAADRACASAAARTRLHLPHSTSSNCSSPERAEGVCTHTHRRQ